MLFDANSRTDHSTNNSTNISSNHSSRVKRIQKRLSRTGDWVWGFFVAACSRSYPGARQALV